MSEKTKTTSKWPMSLAETIIVVVIVIVVVVVMAPLVQQQSRGEGPNRQTTRRNMLKQIGIALHNYHDVHGVFPPAYISDEQGRPMHSWRVLILPYFYDEDSKKLFWEYDFGEPWNGPNNIRLLEMLPYHYRCPGFYADDDTITAYAAIVGDGCLFTGTNPTGIKDITDGTNRTAIVGEAYHARIRWTEPRDVSFGAFPRHGTS